MWRKVRELGAIYLQHSLCLLPDVGSCREDLNTLKREIEAMGGEAHLFRLEFLEEGMNERLVGDFNRLRDEEYAELMEQCELLLEELKRESERNHFSFAEVEENEAGLERLERWLAKIRRRDHFASKCGKRAVEMIETCREQLAKYIDRAYQEETIRTTGTYEEGGS